MVDKKTLLTRWRKRVTPVQDGFKISPVSHIQADLNLQVDPQYFII